MYTNVIHLLPHSTGHHFHHAPFSIGRFYIDGCDSLPSLTTQQTSVFTASLMEALGENIHPAIKPRLD